MGRYISRWFRKAFSGSLGGADLLTGLLGAVAGVAAHFLPPQQALMTGLEWQIPLWAFGAVIVARIVAGPFLLAREDAAKIKALEERITEMEGQYPHALRLDAVDINIGNKVDPKNPRSRKFIGREIQFVLVMKNTIERPVEYQMREMRAEGILLQLGNGGETLSGNSMGRFQGQSIAIPLATHKGAESFRLETVYRYGKPGALSREVTKKMTVILNHEEKKVTYIYDIDEDRPCQ